MRVWPGRGGTGGGPAARGKPPPVPLWEPGYHRFFTARQLVRWGMIVAALIIMVLAFWQDPLYAATVHR